MIDFDFKGTYIGPRTDLKGFTALLKESPEHPPRTDIVMAQFDSLALDESLTQGWAAFPVNDFLVNLDVKTFLMLVKKATTNFDQLKELEKGVNHWKANHADIVELRKSRSMCRAPEGTGMWSYIDIAASWHPTTNR